jgi:alpha-amylase/alpha-mannosidase (GH57 family)
VAGVQLEKAFVKRLAQAPSNVESFKHGAEIYRQLVSPAQISFEQVVAHYAINSLFTNYAQDQRVYCYTAHQADYQIQRMGSLTLAVGELQLTSEITRETHHFVFAVLHLGGWDFHCCVQPFAGRRPYSQLKEALFSALKQASAACTILAMNRLFGDQSYSLQSLFPDERQRIMRLLSQETLTRLDQLYTQVYRDNYGVLMAFHRDELPVPQELQVAAEIAIGQRLLQSLRALEQVCSDPTNGDLGLSYLTELEAIATEAETLHCNLNQPEANQILQRIIERSLWQLLYESDATPPSLSLHQLERLLTLNHHLNLQVSLAKAQETYLHWRYLRSASAPAALLALGTPLGMSEG